MNQPNHPPEITKYRFIAPQRNHLPFKILPFEVLLKYFSQELSRPHRTDFHKFFWFDQGTGEISVDTVDYTIHSPQLCFVASEQVFSIKHYDFKRGFGIFFLDEFVSHPRSEVPGNADLNEIFADSPLLVPSTQEARLLSELVHQLWTEDQSSEDPTTGCIFRNLLYVIIHRAARMKRKTVAHTPNRDLYHQFRQLLDEQYGETKKVADFADKLSITPKKLNRVTKAIAGMRASELIHERVLVEAKRQLAYSSMSIKNIAYTLGFDDSSNFTKFFKHYVKCSPKHYRHHYHSVDKMS